MTEHAVKPKLAIVYGDLLHYRLALFEELTRRYDLTVYTTRFDGSDISLGFAVEVLRPLKLGPFKLQPTLWRKIRNGNFDTCIIFMDLANLETLKLAVFPAARRLICWGAWITESSIANRLRLAIMKRSTASIFYCSQHLEQFAARGLERETLFVAPNTVAVPLSICTDARSIRDSILFVGSFSNRKGLDRLLKLYAMAFRDSPDVAKLVLVGDGPERIPLQHLARDLGLMDRVEFAGRIEDVARLEPYYARALISVSLCQAGLSVLQSMGFGVPILTLQGSISGGETLNITHGITGLQVPDDDTAIVSALRHVFLDKESAVDMGRRARDHYMTYSTIQNYAQGFFDALEGTRQTKIWHGPGQLA